MNRRDQQMRKLALLAVLLTPTALTATMASAAEVPTCSASCITEYPVPIPVVYNGPFGIAKGLGDNIWFGDQDTIDRIDRGGTSPSTQSRPRAPPSAG
jgi:hypothetical protein